jgi:hypothetical protein
VNSGVECSFDTKLTVGTLSELQTRRSEGKSACASRRKREGAIAQYAKRYSRVSYSQPMPNNRLQCCTTSDYLAVKYGGPSSSKITNSERFLIIVQSSDATGAMPSGNGNSKDTCDPSDWRFYQVSPILFQSLWTRLDLLMTVSELNVFTSLGLLNG